MKIEKAFWLWLMLFLIIGPLRAQNPYNFYRLNVESGLAHKTVYALHQDSEGYLWIGAGTKLQRYDGHGFVSFENKQGEPNSLTAGDVRAVLKDRNDNLWIGTHDGGISLFKNGDFQTITASDSNSINHNKIEDIIELPDGSIYIATWGGGINTFKDGKFNYITHDPNNPNSLSNNNVVDLFYDDESEILWIGTWNGGLNYLKDGIVHRVPISKGFFNSHNARTISKTNDGSIWIGSWGEGLFRLKNGVYSNFNAASGVVGNNNILSLSADGDKLWIGTWGGGVSLYKNNQFTRFNHDPKNSNSISSDFIESSIIDKNGDLWIGTYGSGITKFEPNQFSNATSQKLKDTDINLQFTRSIITDEKGQIWIGSSSGLMVIKNGDILPLSMVNETLAQLTVINTLFLDKDGNIWIGGGNNGSGLFRFDGSQLDDISKQLSFNFNNYFISTITQSSDGSIWIGGDPDLGLVQITNSDLKILKNNPADSTSLTSNDIFKLIHSKDGEIWIGTSKNGISVFKNGIFKNFSSAPELTGSLSNNYIHDIIETRNGEIWIGTENGLNHFDKTTERFKSYDIENGLMDNSIRSIIEDYNGDLWLGTNTGISRMNTKTNTFDNFSVKDGVKESPFHRGAIYMHNYNDIYVGGLNGISIFSPSQISSQKEKPTTYITNILKDGNSILFNTTENFLQDSVYQIPFYKGSLTFQYSDMQLGSADKTYYSYKLNKNDATWTEPIMENSASFYALAPGKYQLMVMSSNNKILWSKPALVNFEIMAKWYQTTFVKVVSCLLLILLVYGLVQFRVNLLKKRSLFLENKVAQNTEDLKRKNRQISDNALLLGRLNKELTATVQELKFVNKQQEAFVGNEMYVTGRELLDNITSTLLTIRQKVNQQLQNVRLQNNEDNFQNEIDDMIKNLLDESQVIINNLNTQGNEQDSFYDSLNILIDSLAPLTHSKIELNWEGDHHLPCLNLASNLFRIIKEALSNSVKYSEAQNIKVDFKFIDGMIYLLIEDDGVGFDVSQQQQSRGISEIHERAKALNATLYLDSKLKGGTSVQITLMK